MEVTAQLFPEGATEIVADTPDESIADHTEKGAEEFEGRD